MFDLYHLTVTYMCFYLPSAWINVAIEAGVLVTDAVRPSVYVSALQWLPRAWLFSYSMVAWGVPATSVIIVLSLLHPPLSFHDQYYKASLWGLAGELSSAILALSYVGGLLYGAAEVSRSLNSVELVEYDDYFDDYDYSEHILSKMNPREFSSGLSGWAESGLFSGDFLLKAKVPFESSLAYHFMEESKEHFNQMSLHFFIESSTLDAATLATAQACLLLLVFGALEAVCSGWVFLMANPTPPDTVEVGLWGARVGGLALISVMCICWAFAPLVSLAAGGSIVFCGNDLLSSHDPDNWGDSYFEDMAIWDIMPNSPMMDIEYADEEYTML